jgi:hypothetical protein
MVMIFMVRSLARLDAFVTHFSGVSEMPVLRALRAELNGLPCWQFRGSDWEEAAFVIT